MDPAERLTQTFNLQIGKYTIAPAYWHAIAIVILIFLLIFTMASVRRHFLEWSVKGAGFGIFLGFLLALILEGFLLLGGRTVLTQVLGWENPPKPIAQALDAGKVKLATVLGSQIVIPESSAEGLTELESVIRGAQSLNASDSAKLREFICQPQ